MREDERNFGLVLPADRIDRKDGQVGSGRVPVEGHEGGTGRDVVAMGQVGSDRKIANLVLEFGDDRSRVLVLGRLEPPSHGVLGVLLTSLAH